MLQYDSRHHDGLALLAQKIPASQYLHVTLAVLVRYNQAQKCAFGMA